MLIHLITTHPRRFNLGQVRKYLSFSEIGDVSSDDLIIINDYKEDEYIAGVTLSKIIQKSKISHLMYLTDEPKLNMSSLVSSLGGVVDTEDYLLDEETLNVLIQEVYEGDDKKDNLPEVQNDTDIINMDDINVISTFYRDFALGKIKSDNKRYLEIVDRAIKGLNNNVDQAHQFTSDVRETINDLYEKATKEISVLEEDKNKVTESFKELSEKYDMLQGTRQSTAVGDNSFQNFNSYKVVSNYGTRYIVFKEYSDVRYLTSFVLGYVKHLEGVMHKRVRLIFVVPNKYNYLCKYKNPLAHFQHYDIENEGYKSEESTLNKIGFTEKPINKLYAYFNGLNDDYIVIVDRIHEVRPCVFGKVTTWHCFSGKTESDLYANVRSNKIFSMKAAGKDSLAIPHINHYPIDPVERERVYDKYLTKIYSKMDERTGITLN